MGIFKDECIGWYNVVAKDGKHDLKSISESIKLLIRVNNSELASYTGYLIAVFSIFIPIYFAIWNFNIPPLTYVLVYVMVFELNVLIIIILLSKIKEIKQCNDSMIEQFNTIQAELGGSYLVPIYGTKEEVVKTMEQFNTKYNFEPFTPKFRIKKP